MKHPCCLRKIYQLVVKNSQIFAHEEHYLGVQLRFFSFLYHSIDFTVVIQNSKYYRPPIAFRIVIRDARSPELARSLLVLRFFSWLKIS